MMDELNKRSFFKSARFLIRTEFNYHFSFKKKLTSIGSKPFLMGVWHVELFGPDISIGKNVTFHGTHDFVTRFSTVHLNNHRGAIEVGNNVLIMMGVRVTSASKIIIGDDCMLSAKCYLTDADWHDIYDRTEPVGRTAPIVLEKGVWIGDSAIVCKGVHIGENSIIGAGSVVTKDIPANVVAAGNPARVVKTLDADRIVTLGALYKNAGGLYQ